MLYFEQSCLLHKANSSRGGELYPKNIREAGPKVWGLRFGLIHI